MAISMFRSDLQIDSESAYREWLRHNPDGFVVNALKSASGKATKSNERFTRVHRASCKTINPLLSRIDKAGFTTGRYLKLCTNSLESADNEARIMTGLDRVKACPCI